MIADERLLNSTGGSTLVGKQSDLFLRAICPKNKIAPRGSAGGD